MNKVESVKDNKKISPNPYVRNKGMASYLLGKKNENSVIEDKAVQLAQNPNTINKLALIDLIRNDYRYEEISDKFDKKFTEEMVFGKGNLGKFVSALEKLSELAYKEEKEGSPFVISWQEVLYKNSKKYYNKIIREMFSIEDKLERENKLLKFFNINYKIVAEDNLIEGDGNSFSLSMGNDNVDYLYEDLYNEIEKFLAEGYDAIGEHQEVDAILVNRKSDEEDDDYDNEGLLTALDKHISDLYKKQR